MIRHYKIFLHGRTVDLMASSRTHALNTALELYHNERIYRVCEVNDWDNNDE